MNKKVLRCLAVAVAILWMSLIFCLSDQAADVSDDVSDGIIALVVSAVYPDFSALDYGDQAIVIENYSSPVRKGAHFSEFAVLGAVYLAFFMTFGFKSDKTRLILPCVCGFLYSVSDEVHQLFVPGRACRVTDIYIDTAGVLFGVVFVYLLYLRGDRVE